MDDIIVGRRMARLYVGWGMVSLLAAGCALGLVTAFSAAYGETAAPPNAIWGAHSWVTLIGWIVPFCLGLTGWLLPILKNTSARFDALQRWCLALLVAAALLLALEAALAGLGHPLPGLLPVAWLLLLAASLGYGALVWRVSVLSLLPSAADLGIQAGMVWLILVVLIRLATVSGALATGRTDFFAASEPAVLLAAAFGFVVNMGLGLALAVVPDFLRLPHARPQVQRDFAGFNVALAVTILGLVWCLPYPYSLMRFVLVGCAFAMVYLLLTLIARLRLVALVFTSGLTSRQLLARLALATGVFCLLLAGLLVVVMVTWTAASRTTPPAPLMQLTTHLITVAFFSNLVLALGVPLLGAGCLRQGRKVLVHTAYALLALWVPASVALGISRTLHEQDFWYARGMVGLLAGAASLCLCLWLVWSSQALEQESREPRS